MIELTREQQAVVDRLALNFRSVRISHAAPRGSLSVLMECFRVDPDKGKPELTLRVTPSGFMGPAHCG